MSFANKSAHTAQYSSHDSISSHTVLSLLRRALVCVLPCELPLFSELLKTRWNALYVKAGFWILVDEKDGTHAGPLIPMLMPKVRRLSFAPTLRSPIPTPLPQHPPPQSWHPWPQPKNASSTGRSADLQD